MLAVEDPYYLSLWWYEKNYGKLANQGDAFFHFCQKLQPSCSFQGGYGGLSMSSLS